MLPGNLACDVELVFSALCVCCHVHLAESLLVLSFRQTACEVPAWRLRQYDERLARSFRSDLQVHCIVQSALSIRQSVFAEHVGLHAGHLPRSAPCLTMWP